ncbi:MAG: hypothetical protein J6W19_10485 [Prevotella sp.]|nr:hypothetical protein [Prevotella sp.]
MYAKHIIICILSLFLAASGAEAKKSSQVEKIYIFGMAASFTDTIVHFTPIEEIDSAWIDKKMFLMGREQYSYQLRDYLAQQLLMPQRTCIVVFDKKRKKLEKKYARMLNLYTTPPKKGRSYDVRHIEQQDFRFKSVNMSAVVEQRLQAEEDQKAAEKTSKKKDKKVKKQKKEQPQKPDNNVERRPVSGE